MHKSYSDLIKMSSFEDRFNYLALHSKPTEETFASHRYINQRFYQSPEWKSIRDKIIIRDNGCDLACPDYPINGRVYIHHINPITEDELIHGDQNALLNPENLICVSFATHNALHYSASGYLEGLNPTERRPGDTILW